VETICTDSHCFARNWHTPLGQKKGEEGKKTRKQETKPI